MPAGDPLRDDDRRAIRNAVEHAERTSGYHFSVLLGDSGTDPRAVACARHEQLDDPARSVLIMVDARAHTLEIVTGRTVRRVLDDAEAALAAVAMQSWFAEGDLVGGLVHGLQQLGEHSRAPEMLHFPDNDAD